MRTHNSLNNMRAGGNLPYSQPSLNPTYQPTQFNSTIQPNRFRTAALNTTGAFSNVSQSVQANPHTFLFFLPVLVYLCIFLYGYLVSSDTYSTREYSIFSYISFAIFILGYSRYCTYLVSGGDEMVSIISMWLMGTSIIALIYYMYKIIISDETGTGTTTTTTTSS